ncbi:MAG: hypothetical protein Q8O00_04130 [Holophaga sp.]|nr:hypothetical protein [Holophaga sp.]
MRLPLCGALLCLQALQAAAQTPITYDIIQAKARPAPEQWRTESLLAEHHLRLQESRGFLREGPTLSFQAGPRRSPSAPGSTDKGFEVDLPLFLSPRLRQDLETSLGKAHPMLKEAAQREGALRLRRAYLDAWLATRLLTLRETDRATVAGWLKVAKARVEAGADPAFQVALVEGESLKVQLEWNEAQLQALQAWSALVALTEVPEKATPLADPGPLPARPAMDLDQQFKESPLRKALVAQAELEARSLRLQEAQSLSRWSLRGSHAQEGDEKVTRIGMAVRLPRPGESEAIRRSTEAQLRVRQGEARQALADLEARCQGVFTQLQNAGSSDKVPDFTQALGAVSLRLEEGRERPSEALPIRRQLLEAQMASLRQIYTQHLLLAELQTLLPEVKP